MNEELQRLLYTHITNTHARAHGVFTCERMTERFLHHDDQVASLDARVNERDFQVSRAADFIIRVSQTAVSGCLL